MNARIIREAKQVPDRLRQILHELFDASEPALKASVATLRTSLSRLDSYLQSIEHQVGDSSAPASSAAAPGAKGAPAAGAAPKKARRGKQFGISHYILGQLAKNPKGLRPAEISALVVERTGRNKAKTSANVNTALSRLRVLGAVKSTDGLYQATGVSKAMSVLMPPTKAKTKVKRGGAGNSGERFQTGAFIIETLKKNAKGMRPMDIAAALSKAAPGQHKSAVSTVNTTLANMKAAKKVVNKSGVWSVKAGAAGRKYHDEVPF